MPLLSDLRNSGGFFLYDLLTAPGVVSAVGAGETATASPPDATVTTGGSANAVGAGSTAPASAPEAEGQGYATVIVADPYLGPGSIFYGAGESWGLFEGTPANGDIITHPTDGGFRIAPNGEVESLVFGTWECFYYSPESGENPFSVTIDDSVRTHAGGATATATAPNASLYGGVNIDGAGATVTTSAPQGGAVVGKIAPGPGATATTQAPEGSAAGEGAASGAGVEATASAPDAVGETEVLADGAGVEVSATAPEGSALGDVQPQGAGVTIEASAPTATAVGNALPGTIPYAALFVAYPTKIPFPRAA